jgi:hypothetical protein
VAVGDRYFARIALQESIFQWFRASQEKSAHLNKKRKTTTCCIVNNLWILYEQNLIDQNVYLLAL